MIILITAINIDSYKDTVCELICITSNGGIVYDDFIFVWVNYMTYVHVTVVQFKAYKQTMMDCYS